MWKKCKGCGEMFFGSPNEDFCESCIDDLQNNSEYEPEYIYDVAEIDQEKA